LAGADVEKMHARDGGRSAPYLPCEQGYADRMVLSHDAACFTHNSTCRRRRTCCPTGGNTHLHAEVLPALREHGVSQRDIDTMLVDNPRKILSPATRS
jgi:phosphotriesterase-related protein